MALRADGGLLHLTSGEQGLTVSAIKFDAYVPTCPSKEHGHEPGLLLAEAIADGMIEVFQSLRQIQPEIWLRPTCFGLNPSPWWLFYTNSVIGSFGDDAPYGRLPSPVHRESYTTARDYFNLQGAWWSPVPPAAEEVLGICHQTDEPFLNDAVMVVMRGHSCLPLCLNPQLMDDRRWSMLGALLRWSRQHHDFLVNPHRTVGVHVVVHFETLQMGPSKKRNVSFLTRDCPNTVWC